MSKFMQEYGLIIVAALCFFILIGSAVVFGNPFKQETEKEIDSFFEGGDKLTMEMNEGPGTDVGDGFPEPPADSGGYEPVPSTPSYSIVCGNGADGKHYHNDALFTGTCNGVSYTNGVQADVCFIAGTKVTMADGSQKNIEDIKVGEQVLSYNRITGEYFPAIVYDTKENTTVEYFDIELEDGTIISPTGNHPILTDVGFESVYGISETDRIIGKLEENDYVMTIDGYKKIKSIKAVNGSFKVYNLCTATIEELQTGYDNDEEDTYLVESVVSHNATHSGGSAC